VELSKWADLLKRSQGKQNPRTLLAQRRLVEFYQNWHKSERAAQYVAGVLGHASLAQVAA
jgi:hypothetical protein